MHARSSLLSLILLIHISNDGHLGQAALRGYFPLHVVDSEQIIAHSRGERVWDSQQFAYSTRMEVLYNSANVLLVGLRRLFSICSKTKPLGFLNHGKNLFFFQFAYPYSELYCALLTLLPVLLSPCYLPNYLSTPSFSTNLATYLPTYVPSYYIERPKEQFSC